MWWDSATPRERVAYFLGTMRGSGYAFPDQRAVDVLERRFATEPATQVTVIDTPPPSPTPNTLRQFNPNTPCADPGCGEPVGPYISGKYPIMCPKHRRGHRFRKAVNHLSTNARRALVLELATLVDEQGIGVHSVRSIARALCVSVSTVHADMGELFEAEQLPTLRWGQDGKARPAQRDEVMA